MTDATRAIDFDVTSLRMSAAFAPRPDRRVLALTGPDRVRFLNGQVTNDVAALQPGQGCLAVKTSAKGRTEAYVRVRAEPERLLLDVHAVRAARVLELLDRYIVMDDCAVADVTDELRIITVAGPRARELLGLTHLGDPGVLPRHGGRAQRGSVVVDDALVGVPAFEVHLPRFAEEGFRMELSRAGLREVSLEALDVVRVEAGIPVDGRELDEDVIPLEAHLHEAIHLHKGCYSGQEVIARATNLGGVQHALVGFTLDGEQPVGMRVRAPGDDRTTGELTSVVRSPTLGRWIALGYVRRAHAEAGTALEVVDESGAAQGGAVVAALPFVG
jgi:folate-binding protein YgfZ